MTDTVPDASVQASAGLPLRVRVVAETPALAAGLGALAAAAGLSVVKAGTPRSEAPEAALVSAGVSFTSDLLAGLTGAGVIVVGGDPVRARRALAGRVRGWGVGAGRRGGPGNRGGPARRGRGPHRGPGRECGFRCRRSSPRV